MWVEVRVESMVSEMLGDGDHAEMLVHTFQFVSMSTCGNAE